MKTIYLATLFPSYLLSFASFFCVTALTVDRFLAIHLHLRYNELVTHKRVVAVLISVWMLSAFLLFLRFLVQAKGASFINATVEAVCIIITAVLYWKIYLAVRYHKNQMHALQVQQEAQNGEMANAARLRKSAIATFYVYLVFLICYLPHFCILATFAISGPSMTINILTGYDLTLVFLNSSLNPLIYSWKMRHIRHTIMNILRQILPNHN